MPKQALQGKEEPTLEITLRPRGRNWLERLWSSIAERGRGFAPIPASDVTGLERARQLTRSLLSERGEASGAAVSRELLLALKALTPEERRDYYLFLAEDFNPDEDGLAAAARDYLAARGPETAAALARASEPPRQEVLRRINMAQGGTALLVALRRELNGLLKADPVLKLLDADMRHLFASWFNRGFLELRRIDWQTSAAILEKLIAYEAVHEIQGWDDLRRRLAADRRCFAFFHPALPDEPLIFVEVALVSGLAGSVQNLLERDTDEASQIAHASKADSAIFYSISNCQDGLRGISFGNFLIKQVVEELRAELPGLKRFATLSPVPGLRSWLTARLAAKDLPDPLLSTAERAALLEAAGLPPEPEGGVAEIETALAALLSVESWTKMAKLREALRPALLRLAAIYLTQSTRLKFRIDPVARFHLGNGARLERINWMANANKAGIGESYGIMVNYLYDPALIEANHEIFTRDREAVRADAVEALLTPSVPPARPNLLRRYVTR
ncbi:malonyl-CoA decarboxylase [Acidocella sp.]|uniref:malonyl-CoA decarboxylase n=1 Tax=Acidocella sp. TaxID=50710 RepID=UPI003D02DCB7